MGNKRNPRERKRERHLGSFLFFFFQDCMLLIRLLKEIDVDPSRRELEGVQRVMKKKRDGGLV